MDEYLAFAQQLAREAGQLIKDGFDKSHEVELKADHSPVTEVDLVINRRISQTIKRTYPDHGLMGEELSHGSGTEPLQWLCDPLDGTKAFVLGAPLSTAILGLMEHGKLLLGVVYDPFSDRLYHAVKGRGAFCNGRPIKVNDTTLADGGFVLIQTGSARFADGLRQAGAQIEPLPGAGYRAMVLASGRASAVVQLGADFHDTGPSSLIVEEAGGTVTDLDGATIRFDRPITNGIVFSNTTVHNDLLKVVAKR
jgi:fructose-1,6-bisphosphatase/inositol monophosphatase family enzyme